jgi:Tol biopolymer transport system component
MKFRVAHCLLLLVGMGLILPTPAHATFRGKNGRIAFILGPDVYTMNPNGTDVKQLTNLGEKAAFWQWWSPDGKQIVFNIFSPPFFNAGEIWLMNADGSNQHMVLKEENFNDERPSFTPDGRSLLFDRCSLQIEECALYRISTDGSGLSPLSKFELGISDLSPVLSPDGQSLVFTGIAHGGIFAALYLKGTSSSSLRQMTPAEQEDQLPDWSPDGSKIAFSSPCCNPQNQEIWTVNPDGSHPQRLTNNGNNYFAGPHDFAPSWSPQGDAIVFERDAPDFSSSQILVMKADGTGLTKAISLPHSARAASIRNRAKPGGAAISQRRLKQIQEGGFLPRWGPASD